MTDFLAGLGLGLVLLALAFLLGLFDNWIVFHDPKPRGWRYWPWAFRYFREHGSWPL